VLIVLKILTDSLSPRKSMAGVIREGRLIEHKLFA
jgi:hypothetical protein